MGCSIRLHSACRRAERQAGGLLAQATANPPNYRGLKPHSLRRAISVTRGRSHGLISLGRGRAAPGDQSIPFLQLCNALYKIQTSETLIDVAIFRLLVARFSCVR